MQPVSRACVALQACRSLAKRLTKFYGAKVTQMDPASVPYIVHPKETPSTADGLFVVDAGGTAYGSWSKMVFVLEAKLSVNVRTPRPPLSLLSRACCLPTVLSSVRATG